MSSRAMCAHDATGEVGAPVDLQRRRWLGTTGAAAGAGLIAPGGFLCPCHGSRFDLAGRVVKNVPAPTNLDIPEHRYTGATALKIG